VDFFRIKSAGSSNYRGSVFLLPEFTPGVCLLAFLPGAAFFAFGQKKPNTKSERIALISEYPDNHCLLTRYPDNRYSIQSTNYYVRNYQRNMQNKPNSLNVQIYINIYDTKIYKNKTAFRRGKNKPNSNPIKACPERSLPWA